MSTSTERTGVGEWIVRLISTLAAEDKVGYSRLVSLVYERRARIGMDDETVVVWMSSSGVVLLAGDTEPVDGVGSTTRAVVLTILDGRLEVADAIRSGLIEVRGEVAAISRMFTAIEILIDASSRTPGLRLLATALRAEDTAGPSPTVDYPDGEAEAALLGRLGLL